MRNFFKPVTLLVAFVIVVTKVNAQKKDSIVTHDFLFTVTDTTTDYQAQIAAYKNYFFPAIALKFAKQLYLTAIQIGKLKTIDATLKLKEKETDISYIRNERMLDSLFLTGKVNEGIIIFYTNRYGLYEGERRGAELIACYDTRKTLTLQQVRKLATLTNHN